jgi:hypothetical protein
MKRGFSLFLQTSARGVYLDWATTPFRPNPSRRLPSDATQSSYRQRRDVVDGEIPEICAGRHWLNAW